VRVGGRKRALYGLNLYTTGPHNFIAAGVFAHSFTELRWLRT